MQFEGVPSAEGEEESDDDEIEIYTVTDIAEDRVVLDANHPLAGMALRFWVQVSEIREATPEEVDHGHPHGASGLEVEEEDDELEELENALNPKIDKPPTLH
jgi:FKBP-type peptidyl-prolyl cis-trans isomerase SlyD